LVGGISEGRIFVERLKARPDDVVEALHGWTGMSRVSWKPVRRCRRNRDRVLMDGLGSVGAGPELVNPAKTPGWSEVTGK